MGEKPPEKAETANQESKFRIRHLFSFGWLAWAFIILIAYVLSIGPATKIQLAYDLASTHPRVNEALGSFYMPITVITDNCAPADNLLNWYIRQVWQVRYPVLI